MSFDDDPDIAAIKAQQRAKTLKTVGVIVAVLVVVAAYPLMGIGAVRSQLEAEGYSEVKVELKGPFEYSFEGKRGTARCSGRVERMPGSTSRNEMCFDVK